jgi:hypothetical protein
MRIQNDSTKSVSCESDRAVALVTIVCWAPANILYNNDMLTDMVQWSDPSVATKVLAPNENESWCWCTKQRGQLHETHNLGQFRILRMHVVALTIT